MYKKILFFLLLISVISPVFPASRYAKKLCSQDGYTCYRVKRGDNWESLFPDQRDRDIVRRLNRMNTELYAGLTIAIPKNLSNIDHMSISPFPERIPPVGEKKVVINLTYQAFAAYDAYGYLVHWGPISGGQNWCPDVGRRCTTPTGRFRIYHKRGADCISYKFPVDKGGAPMPYCMFFYGGYAMHASTLPGYHASHGCVRMFYEDAKWLNQDFINVGKNGTLVVIQSI
ncbi:MAG: L,D-transpeptidase [Gammaproteobacteria bacterium]|nr:L,D-transpeptidase [Gammaproteobacteria bacterium]